MERKIIRLDESPRERRIRLRHVVIAHSDVEYTAQLHDLFQRKGFSVHLARSGEQARFLTRRFQAEVVVLDTDSLPESGWLTCHKLALEHPASTVILVAPVPTAEDGRLANFVHASAIVDRLSGADGVLEEIDEIDLEPWTA